jgi:type IV pilus assembly protein PilC
VFTNLYVALTKAGEVSGNLNEILDDLATYLENLDDTRRKVRSAMTYPIFMVVFLGAMMSAMFLWIIPMFSGVYAQLGANLPPATQTLVGMSEWMSSHFGQIIIMTFFVTLSIWLVAKTQQGGFVVDSIKRRIPIFGNLLDQSILKHSEFCLALVCPLLNQ